MEQNKKNFEDEIENLFSLYLGLKTDVELLEERIEVLEAGNKNHNE